MDRKVWKWCWCSHVGLRSHFLFTLRQSHQTYGLAGRYAGGCVRKCSNDLWRSRQFTTWHISSWFRCCVSAGYTFCTRWHLKKKWQVVSLQVLFGFHLRKLDGWVQCLRIFIHLGHQKNEKLVGGNCKIFCCSPRKIGEDEQWTPFWRLHIFFPKGWEPNHQGPWHLKFRRCAKIPGRDMMERPCHVFISLKYEITELYVGRITYVYVCISKYMIYV